MPEIAKEASVNDEVEGAHDGSKLCKRKGFDFWRNSLHEAKFIVAPMVDQSELAWRMLSRKYEAELCYTPMLHAALFVRDEKYRLANLTTCPEDHPLIVQFCANDPDILVKAGLLAQHCCDAIDLNLGCPQMIAKRGHYGAYLQDQWKLLEQMISRCHQAWSVPVTCKIRVFESVEQTVAYAKMLEMAGCQLLTVHGRTREMKGAHTGTANWEYVKAVRAAVNIPIFSNGNIQSREDVDRCLNETQVQGVMTAEGNLHNPALFTGKKLPVWQVAREYLELTKTYPCPVSFKRGHLFKVLHHALQRHSKLRETLTGCKTIDEFLSLIEELKSVCTEDVAQFERDGSVLLNAELPLPYWICQPYVRPDPKESGDVKHNRDKRQLCPVPDNAKMSRKRQKKLLRNPGKCFLQRRQPFSECSICRNPRGTRCDNSMCKLCCKKKSYRDVLDCAGHRYIFKTRQLQNAQQQLAQV